MVFVGRILDGLTAGNLSIAQAYISDHTRPEERAKAFGVIGVAFGFGFMFGPALGGWLGEAYGMHMPFVVAACLSLCSILATYTLLPRDEPKPADAAADTAQPPASKAPAGDTGPGGRRPGAFDFRTYAEYFRRPGILPLYVQFFLFALRVLVLLQRLRALRRAQVQDRRRDAVERRRGRLPVRLRRPARSSCRAGSSAAS